MQHRISLSIVLILLCVSLAFAQEPVLIPETPAIVDPVSAPSCIRILKSTDTEATIQFEPHGGELFEAERLSGSKWAKYSSAVRTSGKTHSMIVPLYKNNMNNIRICVEFDGKRLCSTEGVYAKR